MLDGKTIRVDAELWAALRERSREGDTPKTVIDRVLAGKARRSSKPSLSKKPSTVVKVSAETWAKLAQRAKPFETPCRCLRRLLGIPKPGEWGGHGSVSADTELWERLSSVAAMDAYPATPRNCLRLLLKLPPKPGDEDKRWTWDAPRLPLAPDIWLVLRRAATPFEPSKATLGRLLGLRSEGKTGGRPVPEKKPVQAK